MNGPVKINENCEIAGVSSPPSHINCRCSITIEFECEDFYLYVPPVYVYSNVLREFVTIQSAYIEKVDRGKHEHRKRKAGEHRLP